MLERNTAALQGHIAGAVEVMGEICQNADTAPQTRLNTADMIIRNSLKLTEQNDILKRLDELEKSMLRKTNMDSKSISRRLAALQQIADRRKPCKVVVTFADGSNTTTDPAGAIDIFRERGPFGTISSFSPDRPEYDGLCGALSALCNPAPNRRLEDFE